MLAQGDQALRAGSLFTAGELDKLAELLASVRGTADQLGRGLVRDWQRRVDAAGELGESLLWEGSYFAECPRDEKGYCLPGGGGNSGKKAAAAGEPRKFKGQKDRIAWQQKTFGDDGDDMPINFGGSKATPVERESLRDYAGEAYTDINDGLRGGPMKAMDPATRAKVKVLDGVIKKNQLPETAQVYRGLSAQLTKVKVGDTFTDKGFMSTSMDPAIASGFADGVVFRIKVPKGTNAALIGNKTPVAGGGAGSEEEILLGRGTKIKVTGYKKVGSGYVVDAEVVPKASAPIKAKKAAAPKALKKLVAAAEGTDPLDRFTWPEDLVPDEDAVAVRLDVPVELQTTDYSCGAAAFVAVAKFFGLPDLDCQCEAITELRTSPSAGTRPESLVVVAREHGLDAEAATGLEVEDLLGNLQAGRPVIVALQAYGTPAEVVTAQAGHYVVVIGYDDSGGEPEITVMDPASGYATIAAGDFERHWYDQEEGGDRYERFGVAFSLPAGGPEAVATESLLHEAITSEPVPFLQPEKAVGYFRGLVPELGTDPQRFGQDMRRQAFTMAAAVDKEMLGRAQGLLAERLETGQGIRQAIGEVKQLVSDTTKAYAEMVVRTNLMDAYNQGSQEELADPDMQETFPVWRYANPVDTRSRPEHAERDGRYYPSSVPFTEVRGTDISEVANCRCVAIAIDRWEWQRLKETGAAIADGYPDVPSLDELRPAPPKTVEDPTYGQPAPAASAWSRPPTYWGSAEQSYYRPGPNPTADNVVTRDGPNGKEILLIQRKEGAAEGGKWALPGGFHDTATKKGEAWKPGAETAEAAAKRELTEETGLNLDRASFQHVGFFDRRGRDPRDNPEAWSVSNAFKVHLSSAAGAAAKVKGQDDAAKAQWVPVKKLETLPLAFDHKDIVRAAGVND